MRVLALLSLGILCGPAVADEVVVGAGDIALCSLTNDEKTANLLDSIPGTVITLGDNVYPSGTADQFARCYGPSWGRHKARTKPAIGNHEYATPGALGYLGYFGVTKNYSFDLGEWHLISLDSNCQLAENGGSCAPNSPTMMWLKADLAAHPNKCTLVYFHHPRWSSGLDHGSTIRLTGAWKIMYNANVDLVLSGHSHDYERFAPLDGNGAIDNIRGIRSFVVATGGAAQKGFQATPLIGSEVRQAGTYGVIKLTLGSGTYTWDFVPISSQSFTDHGTGICH
jgi:acid phosphatase type 7